MNKFTMKPLNNTTWILSVDGERHALVSQQPDGKISLFGKINGLYKNMTEFTSKFPKLSIEEPYEPLTEKEQGQCEGYPIKHSTWYNVAKEPLPNYSRTENSAIKYAAGYYALKFPNGWSASFCPKLSTLAEYEYTGPFTTKIEMQSVISSKNKTLNI